MLIHLLISHLSISGFVFLPLCGSCYSFLLLCYVHLPYNVKCKQCAGYFLLFFFFTRCKKNCISTSAQKRAVAACTGCGIRREMPHFVMSKAPVFDAIVSLVPSTIERPLIIFPPPNSLSKKPSLQPGEVPNLFSGLHRIHPTTLVTQPHPTHQGCNCFSLQYNKS